MELEIRAKDIKTMKNSTLQSSKAFTSAVKDLENTFPKTPVYYREYTGKSFVYWLEGDLRLLASKKKAGYILKLGQHSGRGRRGGSYELVNSGGSYTTYDSAENLLAAI